MLSKTNVKAFAKLLEFKNGLSNVQTNGDNFQLGVDDANLYLEENIIAQGPMTCVSTLNISGTATFEGQVNITTLNVSNTSTLRGVVSMGSSLNVSGVSTLDGAVTLKSSLNVSGVSTLDGAVTLKSSLNVSGVCTLDGAVTLKSSLNVSGVCTLDGAVTLKSSLNVSGVCTLQGATTELSTLNVSGITTINNTLKAQEVHQQYASNSFALLVPTGSVITYAGTSAPNGWLICDGSAVSRVTYANLFTTVSTLYGTGNGSTTFNLPDLRSKLPIGAGQGSGLTNRVIATTGGQESITNVPAHTHTGTTNSNGDHTHTVSNTVQKSGFNTPDGLDNESGGGAEIDTINTISTTTSTNGAHTHTFTTNSTGNASVDVMNPFLVLNYIIKY
jgi:microcystin-dependent protein/cytoskeletal protein CcmA (bactofilin family)